MSMIEDKSESLRVKPWQCVQRPANERFSDRHSELKML